MTREKVDGEGVVRERVINIGGKMELEVQPGERIVIHTPGGGAWGAPLDKTQPAVAAGAPSTPFELRGSVHEWNHAAASAS